MAVPAAIVLTGGRSRRMGVDKASLVVDGITLLDRTVGVLEAAGIEAITVAGPGYVPDPVMRDEHGDAVEGIRQGPMAGVVAAWHVIQHAAHDPIVVVSCDLPRIIPDVISALITGAERTVHGAIAFDGERQQPLIAAYRTPAMQLIETAFANGERSLRRCFQDWDLVSIAFDPTVLQDADEPSDLDGLDVRWPNP